MTTILSAIRAGALGMALCFASAPALAAGGARAEFAVGQKLFDAGRQADALLHFRKAFEASKSPNARLMIARCLVAMGRTAEAYEEMAATTREAAARADSDRKYGATRDAAAAELALLERRVGKVVIALAEPGAAVAVTLDGSPLAPERVGVPVAVEPGMIRVVARRPGGAVVEREVKLQPGELKTVAISFTVAAPKVAPPPPPPPPPPRVVKTGGGGRTAGFVVASLGVAGFGTFVGAGLAAKGKFSTLESECGGARCTDPRYADVVDSGKTLQTVANVGMGVGIAGVVGGALMIALGGPSTKTVRAAFNTTPGGAALQLEGSF